MEKCGDNMQCHPAFGGNSPCPQCTAHHMWIPETHEQNFLSSEKCKYCQMPNKDLFPSFASPASSLVTWEEELDLTIVTLLSWADRPAEWLAVESEVKVNLYIFLAPQNSTPEFTLPAKHLSDKPKSPLFFSFLLCFPSERAPVLETVEKKRSPLSCFCNG